MEINIQNSNISSRLSLAFATKGVRQIDLVNKYEYLSPPLINKFFKSQKTVTEILIKLCIDEDINIDWLCTGRGNMFIDDSNSSVVNVNNKNGNVAVNGSIVINTKDYVDGVEIKELLELLKDVPKPWIETIIEKLKISLEEFNRNFK